MPTAAKATFDAIAARLSSMIRTAVSASSLVSTSGGAQAQRVAAGAEHQQAAREALVDEPIALLGGALLRLAIAHQLDADHQPLAAHVADQRVLLLQFAQPLDQMRADVGRVGHQRRPCSSLIVASAAAHDTRIAAERAGVRARRPRHDLGARRRHARAAGPTRCPWRP